MIFFEAVTMQISRPPYFQNPNLTVAWTSSIAGHCRSGRLTDAAMEFVRMRIAEVEPNHITFLTLISGCAHFPSQTLDHFGGSIHGCVHKLNLDVSNVMVGTALVCMYSKSGRSLLARQVFDKMHLRNPFSWNAMIDGHMKNGEIDEAVSLFQQIPQGEASAISWTALITGFIRNGYHEQGLSWFREMQISMVEPDHVSIISALSACSNLGALGLGLWLNRLILIKNYNRNIRINNSLIEMYCRCGCIKLACQVFQSMPERTLVSWNTMIAGFASNGYVKEALEFFEAMPRAGLKPDSVSFTGALTACSHAGLVHKGELYFNIMQEDYQISPKIEHYGCIVDLYSRAGRLEDALQVIKTMTMMPNEVVLGSLMAGCGRNLMDIDLAERLTKYLVEIAPGLDSNYVMLSNVYAAIGQWSGASKVRKMMKDVGVKKRPGYSSVEVGCCIHEFVAGDRSHLETEQIYEVLSLLSLDLRMYGYIPGIRDESHGHI